MKNLLSKITLLVVLCCWQTVDYLGAQTCSIASSPISVDPPGLVVICSANGNSATLTPSTDIDNPNYTWQRCTTSMGNNPTGCSNVANVPSNGEITVTQPGKYTVTASSPNGMETCMQSIDVVMAPQMSTPIGPYSFCGSGTLVVDFQSPIPAFLTGNIATDYQGAIEYTWTVSNSSITGLMNGTYMGDINEVLTDPGTAQISVTPRLGNCSGSPVTFSVTVTPPPTISISPASATICQGSSTTLTATPPMGTNPTYVWSQGFAATQSISVNAAGTYTVIATFANCNSATATATATVTSISAPAVTISGPSEVCSSALSTTQFTAQVTPAGTYNYQWSSPPGGGASFITPLAAGNYMVTVTVPNSACSATAAKNLAVVPTPGPVTAPGGGALQNISVCTVSPAVPTINFACTNSTQFFYTVTGDNIGLPLNAQIQANSIQGFTATAAGMATVSVFARNTNGSINCDGPVAMFTITNTSASNVTIITPNPNICSGAATTLTAQPAGATYAWSNGLGSGQMVSVSTPGTYTVTVTIGPNCTNSASITINALEQPANITVSNPAVSVCVDDFLPVITFASSANANFMWSIPGTIFGVPGQITGNTATIPANANKPTVAGTVTGMVTATINGQCPINQNFTITAKPLPEIATVPNVGSCSGQPVPAINFSSVPSGATFAWTSSNTTFGYTNGMGNIPQKTVNNTTQQAITTTISVTPTLNGCTGAAETFDIVIQPDPPVPILRADFEEVCLKTVAYYVVSNPSAGANYEWKISDESAVNRLEEDGSLLIVEWRKEGNFKVIVAEILGTSGLCRGSDTLGVKVKNTTAPPAPDSIGYYAPNNILICPDSGLCYQWYAFDQTNKFTELTGETFQAYGAGEIYDEDTRYLVKTWDCSNPACVTLSFRTKPIDLLPLSSQPELRLFPNPNNGQFQFEGQGLPAGEYQLLLTDVLGRPVGSETVNADWAGHLAIPVHMDGKPSGMYCAALLRNGKRLLTKTFIVYAQN